MNKLLATIILTGLTIVLFDSSAAAQLKLPWAKKKAEKSRAENKKKANN